MQRSISILILGILLGASLLGQGQSQKLKDLQRKRLALSKQIEQTNKSLQEVKRNSNQQTKMLRLVERQVQQRQAMISTIGIEITTLEQTLDSLSSRITELQSREQRLLVQYAHSLKLMQKETQNKQTLLFWLSAKDWDDLKLRQSFWLRYIHETRHINDQLKEVRQGLETSQREADSLRQQKKLSYQLRTQEQHKLQNEQRKYVSTLGKLKSEAKRLANNLEKQKKQSVALEAEIQRQIALEIAAEEKRQREAEAKKRESKTKGTKTDRPSQSPSGTIPHTYEVKPSLALTGSFKQNKGKLPLPIKGRYSVVRRYGKYQSEKISGFNGGIDLRSHTDQKAYAVFDGVVSRIFFTEGFGQSVIVKHGIYFTVYANLSQVQVSAGQKISRGMTIGLINQDNVGGRGGVLHFQLWQERNKQNPELWLRL